MDSESPKDVNGSVNKPMDVMASLDASKVEDHATTCMMFQQSPT